MPVPLVCGSVTSKVDLVGHYAVRSEPPSEGLVGRIEIVHVLESGLRVDQADRPLLDEIRIVPRSKVADPNRVLGGAPIEKRPTVWPRVAAVLTALALLVVPLFVERLLPDRDMTAGTVERPPIPDLTLGAPDDGP